MSDLLLKWLAEDVGVQVQEVEKDFANGYLWGQVFSHFSLQPDFDKFENKHTPDAMINNYTRLQPTFKRLGVTINTRLANSMMREEAGVAMRLLYAVKQNISSLTKDLQKYKHSGRLGRELGASVDINRTLLEATQFRTPKQTYEQGGLRFFEETMRSKMTTSTNILMQSMHLRRFSERQFKQEAAAAAATENQNRAAVAQRTAFHDSLTSKLRGTRGSKSKQLEHDAAVHASLLRRKEDVEREELRVELALAEAARRRKGDAGQRAAQDVAHGIDTFEINMKRLLKGDDVDDEQLVPATTHSPLEHQAKLRAMATATGRLLEEMSGYLGNVRAQRADDVGTKREREARRRRMLVEQQQAAVEAESRAEAEALLAALARQAGEETRLAERLWQLGQEKEVMVANRMLRETQYAERRAADWEQTVRRELELHASMRSQYQAQTAAELEAWASVQSERAERKAAKHRELCTGIAWQLVQLAERAAEHRRKTGLLVPRGEWRRWVAMFVAADSALGDPIKPAAEPSVEEQASIQAAVSDWLACAGEFERDGKPGAIPPRELLSVCVGELAKRAVHLPTTPVEPLACLRELSLKVAVTGAPFSGKTSLAHALAAKHRLRVLEPEAVIQAAIEEARAWAASDHPQPAHQPSTEGADASDNATAAAATEEEAAPPQPSRMAQMGAQLEAALQAGQGVTDDALVALMVLAIEQTVGWVPPVPAAAPAAAPPAGGGKSASAKPGAKPPPKGPAPDPVVEMAPVQGFVLDGFPRTVAQAALLEKALTGLDLDAEAQVAGSASRLAPPPPALMPQLGRVMISGLDAVITLELGEAEACMKRALGRRLDPETGRVYHLEFDPPPSTDVGLAARLRDVDDASNDAAQVQRRLLEYGSAAAPLDEWHARFSRLRRPVDGSAPLADVTAAGHAVAEGLLRAKAAVSACQGAAVAAGKAHAAADMARGYAELARGHAEGAATELLLAKKAEIQAQALLDGTAAQEAAPAGGKKDAKGAAKGAAATAASQADPAAVELLRAQSAAKCAEQLKACRTAATDAASYAERAATAAATADEAVQRATRSLGDAEVSATAEVEAKAAAAEAEAARAAAADAARRSEVALHAAEQAFKEAARVAEAATVEPDAKLDLAPSPLDQAAPAAQDANSTAVAPPSSPSVPTQLAAVFMDEWRHLERAYLQGVGLTLSHLTAQRDLAYRHYEALGEKFKGLLVAPDNRSALVAKFQKEFNAVDVDARQQKPAQAELVLRSDELREALWALCDRKMEGAETERAAAAADSFVADQAAVLAQLHTALAQVELDRCFATLAFVRGLVPAKHGVALGDVAGLLPPPDATGGTMPTQVPDLLSGQVPPELRDRLDEKSKAAMAMPPWLTQLTARSPALGGALKVAYAATTTAASALIPPPAGEDGGAAKKAAAKKDAGGGKSGGKEGAPGSPPSVPPEVASAIVAELAALGSEELRVVQERLALIAAHAIQEFDAVVALNTSSLDMLSGWIKLQYQAECSAVLALDKVVKAAALAGEPLAADLRLENAGTLLVVDQGARVLPPLPGLPHARPRQATPPPGASILAVHQLAQLSARFRSLASEGYIKAGEVAEFLLRAAGDGLLPGEWQGAAVTALQAALRPLDPTFTGYVDWRQVMVCLIGAAFPRIPAATAAQLAEACQTLLAADIDADGALSEVEWLATTLWFERPPFEPGSAADLVSDPPNGTSAAKPSTDAFDAARELKKVLWDVFADNPAGLDTAPATSRPRLIQVRPVLLYLCADPNLFAGIKKAFCTAAGSAAASARITAAQLAVVAYPRGTASGLHIHRCPLSAEDLQHVVATIWQSRNGGVAPAAGAEPTVTAEQLMYGAHGERVVSHLLAGRYQWHDLLIATKIALC